MNEIVLLVLTWLPVLAESGLFVAIAKFISRHFSIPEKLTSEIKKLKDEIKEQRDELKDTKNQLIAAREELYKATLEMKGIVFNESIKKN